MRPYVVRTGDHLSLLAHRMSFDADAVWNHAKNASLKKLRGNPNILLAGDVLYIPEPPPPNWLPVAVGTTNRLVATVPKTTLSLTFSQRGKPLSSARCVVHGLPLPNEFTTDGSGKLILTLPLPLQEVVLEFPEVPLVRRVRIGHLDPITETSGVIQRLSALGYVSPRSSFQPGDTAALERALKTFQKDRGLNVTGTLDEDTRAALKDTHGC